MCCLSQNLDHPFAGSRMLPDLLLRGWAIDRPNQIWAMD
jgi:hypothetical protein